MRSALLHRDVHRVTEMDASAATVITIPVFPAITIGFIVFFLGAFLTRHIAFLRN